MKLGAFSWLRDCYSETVRHHSMYIELLSDTKKNAANKLFRLPAFGSLASWPWTSLMWLHRGELMTSCVNSSAKTGVRIWRRDYQTSNPTKWTLVTLHLQSKWYLNVVIELLLCSPTYLSPFILKLACSEFIFLFKQSETRNHWMKSKTVNLTNTCKQRSWPTETLHPGPVFTDY